MTLADAWELLKLIGMIAAALVLVTPIFRIAWEGREYRRRRNRK